MAHFYNYETTTLRISIEKEGVFQGIKEAVVSISQGHVRIDKFLADMTIEGDKLICPLSQEETACFYRGTVIVQVNLLYNDSERDVTTQSEVEVRDNLLKAVMK